MCWVGPGPDADGSIFSKGGTHQFSCFLVSNQKPGPQHWSGSQSDPTVQPAHGPPRPARLTGQAGWAQLAGARARGAGLLSLGFGENLSEAQSLAPSSLRPVSCGRSCSETRGLRRAEAWPSSPAQHLSPRRRRLASPGAVGAHMRPQAGLAARGEGTAHPSGSKRCPSPRPCEPQSLSVGKPGPLGSPGPHGHRASHLPHPLRHL